MTVGTTPSRVRYAGDGTTVDFPVPFPFIAAGDLQVVARATADGAETLLEQGTDYSVSGGAGGPGTVHAAAAPPAAVEWVIRRVTARAQEVDYTANDPFPAETHERALDRLTMIAQEQDEALARVPTLPVSSALTALSLPEPVAGRGFKWNEAADALVSTSRDPDQAQMEAEAGAAAAAAGATAAAGSAATAAADAAAASAAATAAEAARSAAETAAAAAQAVGNGVITAPGDLVVGDADGLASRLPVGAEGHILKIIEGLPSYSPATAATLSIFTATGTWTRPPGCKSIFVLLVGPGGGGGGATGASGQISVGAGGGAGEFAWGYFESGFAESEPVTVGAGGAGGAPASTPNSGSDGSGPTSFGALLSAGPGAGGGRLVTATAVAVVDGGEGGTGGTGGNGRSVGAQGERATRLSGSVGNAGRGALSPFGGGGKAYSSGTENGGVGGKGAGGGGAIVVNTTAQRAGGPGGDGVVLVWEFYS